MKLLYITNGINGAGGLERVLSIKASYLAENYNYGVNILCLNEGNKNLFYNFSDKVNICSISVRGNLIQYLLAYKKEIQRMVKELQPDVISVCDDGLKGFFIPLILGNQIPIIYERHASINLNTDNSIKGKLIRVLMQSQIEKFARFVVLTVSNINEWRGNNIQVIPNPLSFESQTGNFLNQKKVIAVGSHSYNKGYDLLLKVWKEVVIQYPDWKLNIYGKMDSDKQFLKLATQFGISTSVNFFEPVKNIKEQYLDSSIMVLSSRSEGFGMVLIEAMACGLPCVSFDCPSGPGDIIEDFEDGFLVENQNIQKFTKALLELMGNSKLRLKMGHKAFDNVQRYNVDVIIKQWDVLFKSLVR